MALRLPASFDAWLADIRWDGNPRYPLSIRGFRFEPEISPPAPYL